MARGKERETQRRKQERNGTRVTLAILSQLKEGVPSTTILDQVATLSSEPIEKEERARNILQLLPNVSTVRPAKQESVDKIHGKTVFVVVFTDNREPILLLVKSSALGLANFRDHVMYEEKLSTFDNFSEWMSNNRVILLVVNNEVLDGNIIEYFKARLAEIEAFHTINQQAPQPKEA